MDSSLARAFDCAQAPKNPPRCLSAVEGTGQHNKHNSYSNTNYTN